MYAAVDVLREPRRAALIVFAVAAATIAGALVFEHGFGYRPCKLCLEQRLPYYVGMGVALALALAPAGRGTARLGLGALALVFLVSTGLGAYHAGVEWGWFSGPSDCGGTAAPAAGNMGDFLNQLQTTRVVACTEAAWRFLGLSLAGWNVMISLALACLAVTSSSLAPSAGMPPAKSSAPA